MEQKMNSEEDNYYEAIIKKTKTGITFPKELRDGIFKSNEDVFFKLIVPKEKDKIILEFLSKENIETYSKQMKKKNEDKKDLEKAKNKSKNSKHSKKPEKFEPKWSKYFVYDFSNKDKVQSILESAFYKFAETPIEFDDALGRVKYAMVSFLTSTKTENAKLFYSVIKFLIDIIKNFEQPRLIDWIYEKVIPNIESKFLYELALIDMIPISVKYEKFDKAENSVKQILESIDEYNIDESYNIMNSFKQLVKRVKNLKELKISSSIFDIVKEKLVFYEEKFQNNDYKIQIIELLEDLDFVEKAYELAEKLLKELDPESVLIAEVRRIRNRLKEKPL